MHYAINTTGNASFEILADGVPIVTGPKHGKDQYPFAYDSAIRLVAFANVAIALHEAVEKTGQIENTANPLPLVG